MPEASEQITERMRAVELELVEETEITLSEEQARSLILENPPSDFDIPGGTVGD